MHTPTRTHTYTHLHAHSHTHSHTHARTHQHILSFGHGNVGMPQCMFYAVGAGSGKTSRIHGYLGLALQIRSGADRGDLNRLWEGKGGPSGTQNSSLGPKSYPAKKNSKRLGQGCTKPKTKQTRKSPKKFRKR